MIPQFIPQIVAESSQSTLLNVIRVLNGVQKQLQNILTYLSKKVQLDNILLQQVSLKSGSNLIPHTLGRTLTGWQITRQQGAASIYDDQNSNLNPTVFLTLVASQAVVVDILVF